jgi:Holliday junction resolvasome RuvABC endonuclease subunit
MNEPYILALDISSTHVGVCLYHGVVLEHAEWTLSGEIASRCRQAYNRFYTLLERYPQIDCLAIEDGVKVNFKTIKAQQRVHGAILTLAGQRDIPVIEVMPSEAKKALTTNGDASKALMQQFAKILHEVTGEHASDALGVALACVGKVEVVPA